MIQGFLPCHRGITSFDANASLLLWRGYISELGARLMVTSAKEHITGLRLGWWMSYHLTSYNQIAKCQTTSSKVQNMLKNWLCRISAITK